jgi:hypothetical protein
VAQFKADGYLCNDAGMVFSTQKSIGLNSSTQSLSIKTD